MSRETEIDMTRTGPIPLEVRRAAIVADLKDCTWEQVVAIRDKARQAIKHNEECHTRQNANGMNLPAEILRKNNARHHLVVECCTEVMSYKRSASN